MVFDNTNTVDISNFRWGNHSNFIEKHKWQFSCFSRKFVLTIFVKTIFEKQSNFYSKSTLEKKQQAS